MAQGAATSADVPGKYDVAIAGFGYMLLQTLEPSLPFRSQRAVYSSTPTFVERQNTSSAYGDNQQSFFLTASQHNWSGGNGQRFFKITDPVSQSRFWRSNALDLTIPGQASLTNRVASPSLSGAVLASCPIGAATTSLGGTLTQHYVSATNLFTINATGTTITDKGAHGAGTPNQWGMCTDGANTYIAGAGGIRRWSGTAFTSFGSSTSNAGSLAYLNNTLWSCDGKTLKTYDTAGASTTVFTWKDATGTTVPSPASGFAAKIVPFGGKMLVFFPVLGECPQLYIADTTAPSLIAQLPASVVGSDIQILDGIVYVSGTIYDTPSSNQFATPVGVIYYYANGTFGELWRSTYTAGVAPVLGTNSGRLLFTDNSHALLCQYDPGSGAVSTIGTLNATGGAVTWAQMSSMPLNVVVTFNGSTSPVANVFPDTSHTLAATGTLDSSLIDFETVLPKLFRGITVDCTNPGSGAAVDIAYQVDGIDGSYTSLANSITGGTEYLLTGVTGRSISVRLTLTYGVTSPIVKRVYVRAAPILQSYKLRTYVLDLSGTGQKDPVRIADGSTQPLSGHEMAQNLITAITSTSPISVSDRFINTQTCLNGSTTAASFTAVCEPADCEIYDISEGWDNPAHPGGYVAKITVREI